ncbi:MAG: hypothetical protein ABFR05_01375 [Bacteroidota bacterium]
MASIKNLKKDINNVLSDVIEECYLCQLTGDEKVSAKAEKIIDEAIESFDALIAKIHEKGVENRSVHFRNISKDLETKATALLEKISKISA